jgi:prepilin-type N-terminal cleavage/methylation domain-containing protein
MKKIRISKKGFTLTEIVLVVAIIVILSAASFIGVTATINSAKNSQQKLQTHSDTFENVAWKQVKSITAGAVNELTAPEYTPNIEEAEKQMKQKTSDLYQKSINTWKKQGYADEDIIITKDDDGYITDAHLAKGAKPKTTTTTTTTTTDTSTATDTVTDTSGGSSSTTDDSKPKDTKPKPEPVVETPVVPESGSGRVGSTTGTTAVTGTSVSGSNVYSASINLPVNATEVTLYIPYDQVTNMSTWNGYPVSKSGNYYTISVPAGSSSIGFSASGNCDLNGLSLSNVKVVSYVPAEE